MLMLVLLMLLAGTEARAAAQPQYGGVLKIIDVSEGAQPIGAPWEIQGIDIKLVTPVIETLLHEDAKGRLPSMAGHCVENRPGQEYHHCSHSGRASSFTTGRTSMRRPPSGIVDQCNIKAEVVKGFLSVDVVDDYTVRINVDKYQNNFLNFLSSLLRRRHGLPDELREKGR